MQLIDNPAQATKMWSVRLAGVVFVLSALQSAIEATGMPSWLPTIWQHIFPGIVGFLSLLIMIARVLKQNLDALPKEGEQ